jgi:putative thioredoxin
MMTASQFVFDVGVDEFETRVLVASRDRPVLVDFWADWCSPCKMLAPVLDAVAAKHEGGVLVAKVNSDQERELSAQLGVRSLPTVMLFVDGAVVDRFVGAQTESAVEQFIAPFLPRASDDLRHRASGLRTEGRDEEALELLRKASDDDPDNLRVRSDLATLCLDLGKLEEADQLLARLPANAIDDPAFRRLRARALLAGLARPATDAAVDAGGQADDLLGLTRNAARQALAGQHETALEALMAVLRRSPGYKDGQTESAMRAIFDLLDDDDSLVNRYRRKMASALH